MAEFWVLVSFVVFRLIVLYYKVPAMIAKPLDERAEAIRKEIDEARRLREDAQKLLADYQQKHRSAGQEAEPSSRRRAGRPRPSRKKPAPAEGHAGAPHQARRGQDRPRRGAGGR